MKLNKFVTSLTIGWLLGLTQLNAHAQQAIVEQQYSPNMVYQVNGGFGLSTQIQIHPSEIVKEYSLGNFNAWKVIRQDNVFYLRPNEKTDTNFTIRTEKNTYAFDLHVIGSSKSTLAEKKAAGITYVMKFVYPAEMNFDQKQETEEVNAVNKAQEEQLRDPNRPFFTDYDYSIGRNSEWLVPEKIYDDGKFTYIDLNSKFVVNGGVPSVYARTSEKGKEFIVNWNVDAKNNRTLVVQGVYRFLVLRYQDDVVGLRRKGD